MSTLHDLDPTDAGRDGLPSDIPSEKAKEAHSHAGHVAPARVLRNILAGALGRIGIVAISLACIPFTIRILGAEQYGIVSLTATLMGLASILDLGIAPTMNRELARLAAIPGEGQTMRDLVRTFECFVWSVAAAIAGFSILGAPYFVSWFHDVNLPAEDVRNALVLLGLSVAVQFPVCLYSGGLIGLQEQVSLQAVSVASWGVRSLGAVLTIAFLSPTMEAYLLWNVLVPACQTLALAILLRRHIPRPERRPRFRFDLVKNLWTLAVGISGTSILMVVTTQADKVFLSHILPLEQFGYYMVAWSIAGRLAILTDPIVDSVYPHLTEIAGLGRPAALQTAYRSGVQMMVMAAVPVTLTLMLFAGDVGTIWTVGAPYAGQVATLLVPLVLGGTFVVLMDLPLMLQWAAGISRPLFVAKLAGMLLLVPGVTVASSLYGIAVGVWVWPLVNGGLLILALPIVHRMIFGAEQWWWWRDVGRTALASGLPLLLWGAFDPGGGSFADRFLRLAIVGTLSVGAGMASVPAGRALLQRVWGMAYSTVGAVSRGGGG